MLNANGEERTFTDNINNYDLVLIYAGTSDDELYPPNIIDKSDFNKEIIYFIHGFSSTAGYNVGHIKIDTENNKIQYISKNYSSHKITKVIGIKF